MPEEDLIEPSSCKSVKTTRIGRVFNRIKKRMLFLFDYGDEWHFIVELKRTETPKKEMSYPFIVESVGEVPSQY